MLGNNLTMLRETRKRKIENIRRHQDYYRHEDAAISIERNSQLLVFSHRIVVFFNILFISIGGNYLIAANMIQRLLFEFSTMEWSSDLTRSVFFDCILAWSIGLNIVMYLPSKLVMKYLGPQWTASLGFLLHAIAWLRIGRYFHGSSTFITFSIVAIASSLVLQSLSIHCIYSRRVRTEVQTLAWCTVADSCATAVPSLVQISIEFLKVKEPEVPPEFKYYLWIGFLACGLFVSLYISNQLPFGQSYHVKELPTQIPSKELPSKEAFWDPYERQSFMTVPDIMDEDESRIEGDPGLGELVEGDLQGSLLYSTDIDPREFGPERPERPRDHPVFWKLSLWQKAVCVPFIILCLCISCLQFVILDYLLTSYDFLRYRSKTAAVAGHYEATIEWMYPATQLMLLGLIFPRIQSISLNWKQLGAVLPGICTAIFICLILSLVQSISIQLLTFGIISIIYLLMKSCGIAMILYMFGPHDFDLLFYILCIWRTIACNLWVVWHAVICAAYPEDENIRIQILMIPTTIAIMLSFIMYLYFEPAEIHPYNLHGIINPNLPHITHPNLPQHQTQSPTIDKKPNSIPQFQPARDWPIQPKIRATIFAIAMIPNEIMLYDTGKFFVEQKLTKVPERTDVFGREWKPQ